MDFRKVMVFYLFINNIDFGKLFFENSFFGVYSNEWFCLVVYWFVVSLGWDGGFYS